jgi:hypothetical protein
MDEGAKVPGNDAPLKPEEQTAFGTGGTGASHSHTPRRRKLIWLALAFVVAAIAGTVWLRRDRTPAGPPLILTLPNGDKYQFVGTTYDTRNVPPSAEARLVSLLPTGLERWAQSHAGRKISQYNSGQHFETPQLFIWFHRLGTNVTPSTPGPPLTARLADKTGFEAGLVDYPPGFESDVAWHYTSFSLIPRRSPVLQLNFHPPEGGLASVRIPNPLYKHYPQWKPEPVPAVKMASDVEVRLDDFKAGPQPDYTGFHVSIRSPRGTNERWALHGLELSDATGNVLREGPRILMLEYHPLPEQSFNSGIRGSLWPDEPAWRLKLEIKRASGFAPEEIVTFKNVPVPAMGTTNYPGLTKTVGGIEFALTKFERRPDITVNAFGMYEWASHVTVELPGKPDGVAIDFMDMKADAGQAETYGFSYTTFSHTVCVKTIPVSAKTMDFTFVVQKTRSVEFLVKPP